MLKYIYYDDKLEKFEKKERLKDKLDILIEEGLWKPCEVLPQVKNNNLSCSIRDCIFYFFFRGYGIK